jgi:uncharacterized membrane protein
MQTFRSPADERRRLIYKTAAGCSVVIVTFVLSNYFLKRGLEQVGTLITWSPIPFLRAFMNPWVASGVLLMILWLLARLALLSWADLTYILPINSVTNVITAALGAIVLREAITSVRWAGICCITAGVALAAVTPPRSTDKLGRPE